MAANEFGPLRSRASRKPWPQCPDVVIYRCSRCGRLIQGLGHGTRDAALECCRGVMERLEPLGMEVLPELDLRYAIVGGFNHSAVQFFWNADRPEERPEWVLLKTFTGGYLKYISSDKRPPLVFPLSDEDAYVYCDTSTCKECLFRCKRGFILYAYVASVGLVQIPLEKMSEYFG